MIIRVTVFLLIFLSASFAQITQLGLGFGGSSLEYFIDQNETVWCGVDVGGLYKSDDRCQSWKRMNNQVVDDYIQAILVHPQDANLVFLGTEGALQRSTDRGETWTDIRDGLPPHSTDGDLTAPINAFAVDPLNPDMIYAGVGTRRWANKSNSQYENLGEDDYGRGTIYKSTDRGLSWTKMSSGIHAQANIFDIACSFQTENLVYAGTSRGIYKSTDAGQTWQLKVNGLPIPKVTSMDISRSNDQLLFLTLKSEGDVYGVYKSTDGAETWTAVNNGIPDDYRGTPIRPFHTIIDWKDDNIVYIASTENGCIWKTTDGGANWENAYAGRVKDHGWQSYGNDYLKAYGFAQSPKDNQFLVAGEHWAHMTKDGGESWTNIYSTNSLPYKNRGADFTVCDYVKVDPSNPKNVFMCIYDQGLYRSTNEGQSWYNMHAEMRKDGASSWLVACTDIEIAADGKTMYAAVELSSYAADAGYVIKKSTDGGKTWGIVLNAKQGEPLHSWGIYNGLEIDPHDPDIVYVAPNDAKGFTILKSFDGGATWEQKGRDWLGVNNRFRHLKIDQNNPSVLYLIAQKKNSTPGKIYKSTDAGESWEMLADTPMVDPYDIWIDPQNSDILWVVSTDRDPEGGIFRSDDGGETWDQVLSKFSGGTPELEAEIQRNAGLFGCNGITGDPHNPKIFYATAGTVGGDGTGFHLGDQRLT